MNVNIILNLSCYVITKHMQYETCRFVPFTRCENITLFFMCNCFIIRYMPDDFSAVSKNTERSFFYGVLITLAPEFVEALILDIRK